MMPRDEVKALKTFILFFDLSSIFFSWKDLGMGNQENTFFLPMV